MSVECGHLVALVWNSGEVEYKWLAHPSNIVSVPSRPESWSMQRGAPGVSVDRMVRDRTDFLPTGDRDDVGARIYRERSWHRAIAQLADLIVDELERGR